LPETELWIPIKRLCKAKWFNPFYSFHKLFAFATFDSEYINQDLA
jgi:hypothetical protein